MPQNKSHHYVPQFYLRRFSPNGSSISLYNIKAGRKIVTAGLKAQCCKDYFYGKDQVTEKALADIETRAAALLRAIDKVIELPRPHTEVHKLMLLFVLTQAGRTQYAADAADDVIDRYAKIAAGPMAKERGLDLSRVRISLKEPAPYAMGFYLMAYALMLDMAYKTLVNETDEDFILSDNPIVYYNQLMSFRPPYGNCGHANSGLQIFVPIDPRKTIVFYDPYIYRCGPDLELCYLRCPRQG